MNDAEQIERGDTVFVGSGAVHWTVESLDDYTGSTVYRLRSQLSGRNQTVVVPRGSDLGTYLKLHSKGTGNG
jgi:hypothetical protein